MSTKGSFAIFTICILLLAVLFSVDYHKGKSYVTKQSHQETANECSIYASGWEICEAQLSACSGLLKQDNQPASYDYISEKQEASEAYYDSH